MPKVKVSSRVKHSGVVYGPGEEAGDTIPAKEITAAQAERLEAAGVVASSEAAADSGDESGDEDTGDDEESGTTGVGDPETEEGNTSDDESGDDEDTEGATPEGEFKINDDTYTTADVNGQLWYRKNGQRISKADYEAAKATLEA